MDMEYNCFTPSVGLQGAMWTQLNSYSVLFSTFHLLLVFEFLTASWIRLVTAICNTDAHTTVKQYLPYSLTTPLRHRPSPTINISLRNFKWFQKMGGLSASTSPFLPPTRKHTHTQMLAGENQTNLATSLALWCSSQSLAWLCRASAVQLKFNWPQTFWTDVHCDQRSLESLLM